MSGTLEHLTKRARRVLATAQDEARRLNHNYIGVEHLLLGITRDQHSTAMRVLTKQGVEPRQARRAVERLVKRGRYPTKQTLKLTPQTEYVLELAVEEARLMGHHYIGTEHLLLGMLREGTGIAMQALGLLNLDLSELRTETLQLIMRDQTHAKKRVQSNTPLLDKIGADLTALARENKLDPVIGRKTEIERVIQTLSRRTKNNPILIGAPGVGKTAIVEGLAQRIVAVQVPVPLLDKRVLTLDLGSLVAGTIYRGQFEERMKRVIKEIIDSGSILFIDEIHMLIGAGSGGRTMDAANLLKPALARGELQCVGATTLTDYRKHIEGDAALERRFQSILVEETNVEDTIKILRGIRPRYEAHHQLTIADDALTYATRWADRYITDRYLPDKAIDLIDEAAARVRMYKTSELTGLDNLKGMPLHNDVTKLSGGEAVHQRQFEQLRHDWNALYPDLSVTAEDVAEIVAMWTGVPITKITRSESKRLLQMESELKKRVVGQNEAISVVARSLRRARAGLNSARRPIGSFLFVGPTGVGKTELAKALAEFMFGTEEALVEMDMSEFMERHNVARLVGAPPGYIGYEDGGQLTEAIRRRPYSVILLDDLEKAHPETFNILLQILDEGRLSDAQGHKVDFSNAIIIMTSNEGATEFIQSTPLGFSAASLANENYSYDKMQSEVDAALKKRFLPEFLNRLDSVVIFRQLTEDDLQGIVEIQLRDLRKRLDDRDIELNISPDAREKLIAAGYDPQLGARPLQRVIQQQIEEPLSDGLLMGKFNNGDLISIDLEDGSVVLNAETQTLSVSHISVNEFVNDQ